MKLILIVDDDSMVRRSLVRMLRLHGYAVVEADGVRHAAQALRETRADLAAVLTDYNMPDGTGAQVVAVAHEVGVPAVMLTGTSELLPDLGCEVLTKPSAPDEILAALARAILGGPTP